MLYYIDDSIRRSCEDNAWATEALDIDEETDDLTSGYRKCASTTSAARAQINAKSKYDSIGDLVASIANKAEGVFLWTRLVVKSVLNGLAEGDPIFMLKERVAKFPADLGQFFESILSRVDDVYIEQTAQALTLACLVVESDKDKHDAKVLSSWIDFWMISRDVHGLYDASFAVSRKPQLKSINSLNTMIQQTRTFLSASCKDLLCVSPVHEKTQPWVTVEFLHRTVYEFLAEQGFRAKMDRHLSSSFIDRSILHLLNLVRLQVLCKGESASTRHWMVDASLTMSLNCPSAYSTGEYVEAFERTLLFHMEMISNLVGKHSPTDHSDTFLNSPFYQALPSFLSFQLHRYALSALHHAIFSDSCFRRADYGVVRSISSAILGTGPFRTFQLDEIHHLALKALLALLTTHEVQSYWNDFLLLWANADRHLNTQHIWETAKLFLSKGASTQHFFPARVEEVPVRVSTFLRKRIPGHWLAESGIPCPMGVGEVVCDTASPGYSTPAQSDIQHT